MTVPRIVLSQANSPELVVVARDLFREYARAIETDLEYQGFAAEVASLPVPYVPPDGALLIAHAGADVAGCVALRLLDPHTGEMKRLYVRPAYRNLGLGKRLVEAIIRAARKAGYSELRLDTLPSMAAAQALYRQLGFVEIPPYNEAHLPGTRFYALSLAAKPGSRSAMARSPLRNWAKALKRQTLVVYFAARDPRTTWPVRVLALFVAAYALSPIDLIPDFIPVLGYLDDLIIVPLGVMLVLRLVPPEVVRSAKEQALAAVERPVSRAMAVAIVAIWSVLAGVLGLWVWQSVRT